MSEATAVAETTEDVVDRDFASAIESEMPQGEGPTVQELRVDWLLEKLATERARMAHIEEFTRRRMDMIREHGERESAQHARHIAWLEGKVRLYVPTNGAGMQEVYGKKSLNLPHGTVGYRSTPESVVVHDPARALAWAKANGLPIKVTESIAKTPLHDHAKLTGEVPDPEECGWEIVDASERFYVNAGGAK